MSASFSQILNLRTAQRANIGLGCMSVSGQYDNGVPLSQQASFEFFKGVWKAGCTHFDTAEVYRSGVFNEPGPDCVYNEAQLGSFFRTVPRESFTVGTKYAPWIHGMTAEYSVVKSALLASLARLGLSHVDIYYTHRVPSREYAIQWMHTAAKLQQEGLITNVGLSEVSAEWLHAAHAVHPVCCVQQEWSLLTREPEQLLVPKCRELGVGFVAYSPLARNLLAAPKQRPTDHRRSGIPRFSHQNFQANLEMLAQLERLAHQKECSPAQLSIAWLLHKAEQLEVACLPIPGTKTLSHAQDNMASAALALSGDEMSLLEQIGRMQAGARESEAYMQFGFEGGTARSKL